MEIKTVSNPAKRDITLKAPKVFLAENLKELAKILGEDLAMQMIKAQLMISYRAMIRRKLEEVDDNNEFVHSNEAITAEDFSDWCPKLRITKTDEEKALEALGKLPPEVRKAILENYEANKKA